MKLVTIIIFSILLALVHGRSWPFLHTLGSRIIDGETAPTGAFPYMVSFRVYDTHACGGAILNDRWILSAAHCGVVGLTPYVGTNSIKSGVPYTIEAIFPHPKFDLELPFPYDVALFKVTKKIEFNNFVKPIEISSSELKDNQKAVLSGWGSMDVITNSKGGIGGDPTDLQYFNVSTLTLQTCKKQIREKLHETHICALGKSNQGTCNGDDGSPLVSNGAIVGITLSHNITQPCGNGYPDIYTNVYLLKDWIKEVMEKNS